MNGFILFVDQKQYFVLKIKAFFDFFFKLSIPYQYLLQYS